MLVVNQRAEVAARCAALVNPKYFECVDSKGQNDRRRGRDAHQIPIDVVGQVVDNGATLTDPATV